MRSTAVSGSIGGAFGGLKIAPRDESEQMLTRFAWRKLAPLFVAGWSVALPALAGGSSTTIAGDEPAPARRLQALIERIQAEHQRLNTLEAEFVQHKESSMLLAPIEARGVFSYAAPDRVRWEYESPDPISLLISGDQMTTWYRALGQAERLPVGRHSQRVLKYLGAGSSMETLLEYFTVTLHSFRDGAKPYQLDLEPRFARVAKRLLGMSVWIDRDRFLVTRVRYVEPDGDVTEYRFKNFKINGELPADRFRLDLPKEVKVRTLDLERAGAR